MSERPTPETDAEVNELVTSNTYNMVTASFSRRLERERDEAREAAEKAKAFKRVLKEDNAKLRRELDELNKRLVEVSKLGVDLLIEREDLRKGVAVERALADRLAHALDRMLHLHDNGTWYGKRPDERAREVLKKWKETRK